VPINPDAELIGFDEVKTLYEAWSTAHPMRLQRDDRRWDFWKWNFRMCAEVTSGYFCQEGDTVRECVYEAPPASWPIFEQAEWLGLESMSSALQLPLSQPKRELIFMGRGFSEIPQMFMTDQF
jgi:hypothetical protein